jgi:hypothetical protein
MRLFDSLQKRLRSMDAWRDFRRWQHEGFVRAFRRDQLWRQVLTTAPIRTAPHHPDAVEIHTLCYRLDYLTAIWALKSFYRWSGVDFPLVVHLNGRVPHTMAQRLRTHFPDARFVSQQEADERVEKTLADRDCPRLATARRGSPFMLKLTDFPILASGATVLVIDSDVLFFAEPRELLDRCRCPDAGYLFQQDPETNYNISEAAAMAEFGIRLAPRLNTGILVYPSAVPELRAFERYLGNTDVAQPNGFIEQTLYAMHASEIGKVERLPATYLVDLTPNLDYAGFVARHYAGPSRVLLSLEGMPRAWSSPRFRGT